MPPKAAPQREFVHPEAGHARKKPPSAFAIQPISAFYCFLVANIVSALFAPIQDCDETFNYYEPTHYLSHGYGLQTWEYSPTYAIRSWLYIVLHAIAGNIRRLMPQSTKASATGHSTALHLEPLLTFASLTLNARIGLFFVIATVFSPGNFHASTAYLPSSFAMYMAMLGASSFMNWRGGLKTAQGIFWFALGGVVGWPFAVALCAPFLIEEALFAVLSDKDRFIEAILRVARGVTAGLIVLIEVAAWNIVKYNIFSETGGPELYGTEPWSFYFRNLALNFNIWFVLALLCLPLFLLQKIVSPSGQGFHTGLRALVFISPFYLWLGIFTLQPHKEERFMYPAYPFLALNAAMSLHILLTAFGNSDPKTLVGKIPAKLKLSLVTLALLLSFDISLSRVYGIWSAYHAPLILYTPLGAGVSGQQGIGVRGDNVCFGKEWYRFPSSYFLPRDMHAKFVRSEFRGLLPGEFSEARTGFGFWSGTWLPTNGLNDRNEEDMGKYVDQRACGFLVDTQYPERTEPLPPNEPDYVADKEHWEIVKCVPFLDAQKTHSLARALWVPDLPFIPEKFQRKWGRHCLLKRKK
ncbi:putative Alg9-like mannosyltransferase [Colletotrichum sublineola]|uniref:Mannosyltransferase n=1 Tax=Colletotrichum sublineola TaxID=1173701 RepID=A0A066XSV6_COLSU|nr:putative Alg9-like mannosyltransferase [Colletotrichum sublineola]